MMGERWGGFCPVVKSPGVGPSAFTFMRVHVHAYTLEEHTGAHARTHARIAWEA